ncbi:MAG TPA: STAS domain-containing protein [Gaiellaceae bacterium]|nr:STAS domain-containing protein [Gaiellaceae bacterium]
MHKVEIARSHGVPVVVARGEFDAFAAPDLERALSGARLETAFVVDLDAVSFLDSTALGVVVAAVRLSQEAGTAVRIVLPGGAARRIFEITTLDRILPVAENRASALESLGAEER